MPASVSDGVGGFKLAPWILLSYTLSYLVVIFLTASRPDWHHSQHCPVFHVAEKLAHIHLDFLGVLLLMVDTALLVFVISQGTVRKYAWNSPQTVAVLDPGPERLRVVHPGVVVMAPV
ncbi:hypothetical protein F5B21DRAFT_510185 [Xylaria acuta]|nr:hypothetical protein F5B21DRAFT_510185 [Xylaria acuta]